jgi:hypothetical protein
VVRQLRGPPGLIRDSRRSHRDPTGLVPRGSRKGNCASFCGEKLWICPLCQRASDDPPSDRHERLPIECPRCGRFEIDGELLDLSVRPYEDGDDRIVTALPRLAHVIRQRNFTPIVERPHVAGLGRRLKLGVSIRQDGRQASGTHWRVLARRCPRSAAVF